MLQWTKISWKHLRSTLWSPWSLSFAATGQRSVFNCQISAQHWSCPGPVSNNFSLSAGISAVMSQLHLVCAEEKQFRALNLDITCPDTHPDLTECHCLTKDKYGNMVKRVEGKKDYDVSSTYLTNISAITLPLHQWDRYYISHVVWEQDVMRMRHNSSVTGQMYVWDISKWEVIFIWQLPCHYQSNLLLQCQDQGTTISHHCSKCCYISPGHQILMYYCNDANDCNFSWFCALPRPHSKQNTGQWMGWSVVEMIG